ncbi:MAG: hypothetical protein JOZ57_03995 [Abitibacteriaceae bacterium]|nr:hypothetical protein [Abditibacteriaceae bacterium]
MSIVLYPTPSPEGVAKLQAYYRDRCGMEVSPERAFEVLSGVMRFLYLTEVNPPADESTPTSPANNQETSMNTPPTAPALDRT